MNLHHLHALRDGVSVIRRRRSVSPYIHVRHNAPLMQMLYTITRPPVDPDTIVKKPLVRTAKKIIATVKPGGSMVSYAKERPKF